MNRYIFIYGLLILTSALVKAQADFDIIYPASDTCTPVTVSCHLDPSSIDINTVDSLTWDFGTGGEQFVSYDPVQTVGNQYWEPGTYTITMIVNDNSQVITKTDSVVVKQRVLADFDTVGLGNNEYRFIPTDIIMDSTLSNYYTWQFNGVSQPSINVNNGDITQAIRTVTLNPYENEILLLVDGPANECTPTFHSNEMLIDFTQSPNSSYYNTNTTQGCTPLEITYTINEATLNMDTVETIEWNFGFGDIISTNTTDTTIVYEEPGTYSVSMNIVSENYEKLEILTNYITAHQTVSAAFVADEYDEDNTFRFLPIDVILDSSLAYSYMWSYSFIDGSNSGSEEYHVVDGNVSDAIHDESFSDGTYLINLVVTDTLNGCISSYNKTIYAYPELYVPNIFIPAEGKYLTIDPQSVTTVLHFEVFNRYGLPIFTESAPVIYWDGRTNSGSQVHTGVYYYTLESSHGDPLNKFVQKGFIHIYQ